MTDTRLHDWLQTFDRYRKASNALLAEIDRADAEHDDINPDIGNAHYGAGLAVLYVPALNVVQVAQKIRVADNLFQLGQVHPDLAQILLDDLLSLVGLESGDVPALPQTLMPASN
jgi:hypothetical protein